MEQSRCVAVILTQQFLADDQRSARLYDVAPEIDIVYIVQGIDLQAEKTMLGEKFGEAVKTNIENNFGTGRIVKWPMTNFSSTSDGKSVAAFWCRVRLAILRPRRHERHSTKTSARGQSEP